MASLIDRKRQKEETKNDDVEQCIIDLMDSGEVEDEDDARAICEEIYGEGDEST